MSLKYRDTYNLNQLIEYVGSIPTDVLTLWRNGIRVALKKRYYNFKYLNMRGSVTVAQHKNNASHIIIDMYNTIFC